MEDTWDLEAELDRIDREVEAARPPVQRVCHARGRDPRNGIKGLRKGDFCKKAGYLERLRARIFSRVVPVGECEFVKRASGGDRYVAFSVQMADGSTKQISAHRLVYLLECGDVPDGMVVRHLCHKKRCVKLDHLKLGTDQDNKDDSVSAGKHARHESAGRAKLNWNDVNEIRARYGRGGRVSYRFLADEYNVCVATIGDIVRGITWNDTPKSKTGRSSVC